MESSKKKEILDKLNKTCQIPISEKKKQYDIIKKQEKKIREYKSISLVNFNNYFS